MSKCFRCEKRRSQPLHYLCKQCYNDDDGEPKSAGEEIIRLKRELAEAREQRDRLAVICGELIAAVRVNSMRDTFRGATHNQVEEWLKQWVDRLAAVKGVKGGNDE
jgi:hypothetical protein